MREYLKEIYQGESRFFVPVLSKNYYDTRWATEEREFALARARVEFGEEYVLPLTLDGTKLKGVLEDIVYIEVRKLGIEQVAEKLKAKVTSYSAKGIASGDRPSNPWIVMCCSMPAALKFGGRIYFPEPLRWMLAIVIQMADKAIYGFGMQQNCGFVFGKEKSWLTLT